jgi:anthranilate/para-aminobenzoate synthase component I
MGTNIVFRTLVYRKGQLSFWVGSGSVAYPRLHGEYQESFDKAAAMAASP